MKKIIAIIFFILFLLLKPEIVHGDQFGIPESNESIFLDDIKPIAIRLEADQEPEVIHIDLSPNKKLETYICGYSNPHYFQSPSLYQEEESEDQSDSILINTDAYCHLLK